MKIETFIPHPKWNGNIYDGFDIALERLPEELKNVLLPNLPHEDRVFEHNTVVLALGWGLYDHVSHGPYNLKTPDTLRMVDLVIIRRNLCPEK